MIPYARLLGLEIEPGETAPTYVMPFAIDVVGRPSFLHGGAIGGLLEMAAVGALKQALTGEGDVRIKPINLTVDYMRGGRDKPTRARGTVTRLGTRVANALGGGLQGEPSQASQHERHVRAEHPAVGVALVIQRDRDRHEVVSRHLLANRGGALVLMNRASQASLVMTGVLVANLGMQFQPIEHLQVSRQLGGPLAGRGELARHGHGDLHELRRDECDGEQRRRDRAFQRRDGGGRRYDQRRVHRDGRRGCR